MPFRDDAEAATRAVRVDPTGWGEEPVPRPGWVAHLQEAVVDGRRLLLTYVDRSGSRSRRPVDPWGLVVKDEVWYLVAGTGSDRRTFRLDRIQEVEPTGETAARPSALDLREERDTVVAEVERFRSLYAATVEVPEHLLPVLRAQFGRHCRVLDDDGGRVVRVRVAAPTAASVAEQLAGLGATVDVLDADPVREELVRLGTELVRHHGAPHDAGCGG